MNKLFRSIILLLVFLSLSLNISCDIFRSIDPELKVQRDAYYTIVEAHALKQLWIYDFFGTFSDNYTRGQLFVYEPTMNELNDLWDEFNVLMSYTDAMEAAIDTLEALENDPLAKGFNKSLVSSGVVSSLFDFFRGGKAVSENSRKRILMITSNMPQSEKTELFNDMLRTKWRNEFSDENDFWTKLQNGEIDDKASQIYNDFYGGSFTSDNNTFGTLALDKNLTPGKIFVKEGAKLVEKGAAVIVETAKAATPLGAGIDLVEAGKKWWEKGEKLVDKPMDLVKDEIKERITGKLAGMIDIDGVVDAAGLGEGAGTAVKALMDATIGTSDTQELIEKGIDWGTAKISSPDKSIIPEIVVAEKQGIGGGLPDIILGVGNYINSAGELLLTLPAGNWDITPRDKFGASNAEPAVIITAQEETDVICEENDDKSDSLDVALHNFNFIQIAMASGASIGGGYNIDNRLDSAYALKWVGKSFSVEREHIYDTSTDNQSSYNKETIDIDGVISIASYDQFEITVSVTKTYERFIEGVKSTIRTTRIDGIAVPAAYSRKDSYGEMWSYFIINPVYNSELLPSLSTFLDFEYQALGYYTSGDDAGTVRNETLYNTIENTDDAYINIRLGYTNYKMVTDY